MKRTLQQIFLSITILSLITACSSPSDLSASGDTPPKTGGSTTPLTPLDKNTTDAHGDKVAPDITVIGGSTLSIVQYSNYSEQGATAVDNVDGTVNVILSGTVNTSKVGTYVLSYTAIDKAQNSALEIRTVQVVENVIVAFNDARGNEPWRIDIEDKTASLIKDIDTSERDATIGDQYIVINDITYFFLNANKDGVGLWRTDGTEIGTYLVKPFGFKYDITKMRMAKKPFQDQCVFSTPKNIWISDGTTAGTISLTQDYFASVSLGDSNSNFIYFEGNDNSAPAYHNTQVWRSDGTHTPPIKLTDIATYGMSTMILYKNELYFRHLREDKEGLFCKLDASTSNGVQELFDFGVSYVPFVINDKLLLVKRVSRRIYLVDTENKSLKSIKYFQNTPSLNHFKSTSKYLYFFANDGVHGTSLWRTDASTNGTVRITADYDNTNNTTTVFGALLNYDLDSDTLYYTGGTGWSSKTLYKVIGDATEAVRVGDLTYSQFSETFKFHHGSFYFLKNGLKISDGTDAGTVSVPTQIEHHGLVKIGTNKALAYLPCGNALCIYGATADTGAELWRVNETSKDIELLKDTTAGSNDAITINTYAPYKREYFNVQLGKKQFFATESGALWVSDGSEIGTVKLTGPNVISTAQERFFVKKDNVLYFLSDTQQDVSLYKTDGTVDGTVIIKRLGKSVASYGSRPIHLFQDKLYLTVQFSDVDNSNTKTTGLWESDGTVNGTQRIYKTTSRTMRQLGQKVYVFHFGTSNSIDVFDLVSKTLTSTITGLTNAYNFIFFVWQNKPFFQLQLNVNNKTSTSIYEITQDRNITERRNDTDRYYNPTYVPTIVNGYYYYSTRKVFYKTSTTPYHVETSIIKINTVGNSTTIVKDMQLGANQPVNNKIFFEYHQSGKNYKLWSLDTTDDTVREIRSPMMPNFYEITYSKVINNKLVFKILTDDGMELWVTDGTDAGTVQIETKG